MNYSYNQDKKDIIFAGASDINASFKDLCAVCDAVRYMPVATAIKVLDGIINEHRPIEYKRHNKYMGSRHELGGKKGRYPIKCAQIVRKVVVNASANARNKGEDPEYMYVVHASANKTQEIPRSPSKGVRAVGGNYGYTTMRTANLAFARVEIGIAEKEATGLGARMRRAIKVTSRNADAQSAKQQAKQQPQQKSRPKPTTTTQTKPLPAPQPAAGAANKEAKTDATAKQEKKTEETKKA